MAEMLPTRAYADIPRLSPGAATRPQPDTRPALVVVASPADAEHFAASNFVRYAAHNTSEALRLVETTRPRVVAIDWDAAEIDGQRVCAAARKFPQTGVLVTMASPNSAPAALKIGCHAILLKPLVPNLIAARIGRLSRELPSTPSAMRAAAAMQQYGTNRVWPDTHCPKCDAPSATSFEFYSYRRMWYSCLQCDAVWLGARQE